MVLPYIYDSRIKAEIVADRLENRINEKESLSVNSVHEVVNEVRWLLDPIQKPEWMKEPEFTYTNEKHGWTRNGNFICIRRVRWYGGSGYAIELPEPIRIDLYSID